MEIWVDADACPKAIKEVLYRAAVRVRRNLILVANQTLATPPSPFIRSVRVGAGFDVADQYLVDQILAGDLVITSDIPLAYDILEKNAFALSFRGEWFSKETIRQKLTLRDFMDEMRGSGVMTGGPAPLNQTDRREFANALDTFLAQNG